MTLRSIAITSSVLLAVFASACDAEEAGPDDTEIRHIHFDATEVADVLTEAPETRFLIDLREGNVVHFDQGSEDFDFSAFDAICPSMPAPIPFTEMIESMDLQVEGEDEFSMRSELTETTEFRSPDCIQHERVCNAIGLDCIILDTLC